MAIKILPAAVSADPDRRARFTREARLLAALNHPHIAAIYGLEDAQLPTESGTTSVQALILELVEGPTLAERLARGPVPGPEAVTIAAQIADALDGAHEKGIVHRDLKPANVKVTADGRVKVLDFGLAKAFVGDGSGPDLSQTPTVTAAGTREGLIVGTPSYMSPEQARGSAVDPRTDIWALGCVLYELLTGRRAFPGTTTADTIAAILEREPDWSALPPTTPSLIARLLHRCLDKDPRRRWQSARDVSLELEQTIDPANALDAAATAPTPSRLAWVAIGGLAVLFLVGLVPAALYFRCTSAGSRSRRIRVCRALHAKTRRLRRLTGWHPPRLCGGQGGWETGSVGSSLEIQFGPRESNDAPGDRRCRLSILVARRTLNCVRGIGQHTQEDRSERRANPNAGELDRLVRAWHLEPRGDDSFRRGRPGSSPGLGVWW